MIRGANNELAGIDEKPDVIPPKTFTPVGNFIAIHVLPEEKKAGLVYPQGMRDPTQSPISIVIAIGPDVKQVKEGDKVIFHPHALGPDVYHKGFKYVCMEEKAVCGILIEEGAKV